MRNSPPLFRCMFAAAFIGLSPYNTNTPQHFLDLAKTQITLNDKISTLKQLITSYPSDNLANVAKEQLVSLLAASNRTEEALITYRQETPSQAAPAVTVDFTLLDYLLKTGRYSEVLQQTAADLGPVRDFVRDERLLEIRVQALLATGHYRIARECVERWLARYEGDGITGSRFEGDVQSIRFLKRHLQTLERLDGDMGKALFTASVPDSLQRWSHRRDVPIVFFKLVPAHPAGQIYEPVLPGRHETDSFFEAQVDEFNRGFSYLSGNQFSLAFGGLHTLYVKEGDMDPASTGGHVLTSRVYVHTIPQLYRLAGEAFVVLIDYRAQSEGEAAYMGDGIIHISASKLQPLIMMHEILHGLGATHQEWNSLEGQGHRFDPEDRGLMTFDRGEIRDLGLEEKNRALLGWPQVSVIRFGNADVVTVRNNATPDPAPAKPASALMVADGFIQKI